MCFQARTNISRRSSLFDVQSQEKAETIGKAVYNSWRNKEDGELHARVKTKLSLSHSVYSSSFSRGNKHAGFQFATILSLVFNEQELLLHISTSR